MLSASVRSSHGQLGTWVLTYQIRSGPCLRLFWPGGVGPAQVNDGGCKGGQSGLHLWGQQSLPDRAGEVRQKGEAGEALWAERTAYGEAQRQQ